MAYPSDLARTKNWGTEILTDSDLEGQLDLIIDWTMALANESTGHKHDGTENEGPKLDLTAAVTGVLPVANGGTGVSTAATLGDLFYPVGIVITLGVSTNPNTLLGFGTWTAIEGKVIVGIAGSGTFDTLDGTGGAETHTLETSEIPAHTHTYDAMSGGAVTGNGGNSNILADGDTTGSTGGGGAHNNLQPYIVKYVWQRTA